MSNQNKPEKNEVAAWLSRLALENLHRGEFAEISPIIVNEIKRRRNIDLPTDIIDYYPSPHLLADWLVKNADSVYDPVISFGQPGINSSQLIFCIHPVSGVGTVFKPLAERLRPQFQTYAVHARGMNPGETLHSSFECLVGRYSDRIAGIAGHAPIYLLGWSFGGHIAAAVARTLEQRGHMIELLVLLDSWIASDALSDSPAPLPTFTEYLANRFDPFLPGGVSDIGAIGDEKHLRMIVEGLKNAKAFTGRADQFSLPMMNRLFSVAYGLDMMYRRSDPQPLTVPVLLIRAADSSKWENDTEGRWKQRTRRLIVEDIPHNHLTMLVTEESTQAVADIIKRHCS